MEITFRATEIGSYEDRGQLVCGASNFKDSTAEYHYITVGLPPSGGDASAKPAELKVDFDNDAERHYSITSCLISPSAWRLRFRETLEGGEPISVLVLHGLTPDAYQAFVQSLNTMFAGRAGDLQVGERL